MAIVVRTQPSVESRPIGTPYQSAQGATLDVFGGGQAEGLIRAGARIGQGADQLADIAVKQQLEDNERASKDMDNQLSERIRLLTLGDGTEQNPGYYSKTGVDAVDGFQPTSEALKKARDEILETAPNDRVRDIFRIASDGRLNSELGKMTAFQSDGRRTALDTTSKTRQNEAAQNAAAYWNDPAVIAKSLAIQQGEVMTQARLNGWSEEVIASQMERATTMTYRSQILAAMKVDPDAAQEIYDKVKGSVDGDVRVELEGMLEDVTIASKSQEFAAQFIAEAGGDYTKARQIAQEKLSGAKEDATVKRIDAEQAQLREDVRFRWAQEAKAKQDEAENLGQFGLDEANNIIGATGDISRADAMAAAEQQGYSAKQLDAVRDAINAHYIPIENEEQRQRAIVSSTNSEIDRQAAIAKQAETEASNDAIESARAYVNDGGSSLDWQRENPELYSIAKKRSDFDDVKKVEKWNRQDAATETDWEYFDKVLRYTPEQLSEYGLLAEARTKLASSQFSILQQRVETETDPNKKQSSAFTLQQQIDATMSELGLSGKSNEKKRGKIQTMIEEEIIRVKEANGGKDLSDLERRDVIQGVVDPIILKGGSFFGLMNKEQKLFDVEVPEEDRKAIVQVYKESHNGEEPTEAEIARRYVKKRGTE